MEYQPLLSTYLKNIETINPQTREHTHRTHLENLLKSIKESLSPKNEALQSLRITHEPNNDKEGRGAPDFLIHNQGLIVGYIENKRVNADLDSIAKSPQVEKYLRLSDNLMLTDYLRFALVRNEKGKAQIVQEYRICELSQMSSTLKNKALLQSKEKELIEAFNLFFTHSPKPIITALEFANALAQRTQILKDSLIQAQHNPHILSLYETFKTQLYKELDFIEFSDSFAQSLTYSLFLARLNNTSNKDIDLYNVKSFIPKSFPLIRAMSGFLDNLEDLDSIKWLIEEILYIINNINIVSIIQELNDIRENSLLKQATHFMHKDPYLHFYETFLSQYDPRLREVRGVYYTPASVVSFIINAIDSTLKKDFSLQKGLSAACENDNITLLYFATGTGTFLLEAFRKALESIPKNSPRYEPKKLLSRFFGFEFLIAPYVIAHLKLSQSFKEEFAAPLQDNQSLSILLTNTLYTSSAKDEINKQSNLFAGMIELAEEFKNAQQIKENPILIITGNPPYSGASANKGLYEENVRITYGLEPKLSSLNKQERQIIAQYLKLPALERLNRKDLAKHFKDILNTKKLQNEKLTKMLLDDYVKFINFAESKIKNQNSGIFAFISNNSFLDNPTFRGMRYHLLNTFDTMYILDLHGNARKREVAPDGSKDDNVFDIMQGVSINIFIKNTNASNDKTNDRANDKTELNKTKLKETEHLINDNTQQGNETNQNQNQNQNEAKLAKIYHYDLYGKRIDKANFLYANSLDSINWTTLSPKEPFYLFIPQNDEFRDEYNKGWSVKKIFKVSSVGITSARDKLCISDSFSLESLNKFKDRVKRFLELDIESARKEFDLGEDSRDWKIEYAQKDLKDTGNNPNNYIKIHYRPFD